MQVLIAGLIAQVTAQILKIPLHYVRKGKWDWKKCTESGGMPSAHTAFIVSTSAYIGKEYGVMDPLFGVASIIAIIVIYDALNVRYQAGIHAEVLNSNILINDGDEKLTEDLGHTKREVIAGVIWGIFIGICCSLAF